MKLNLGSGPSRLPGYINIDMEASEKPDVLALLPDIPFRTESVEEVHASHVIEHQRKWDGTATLRECHRVLKPGASLRVSVPDTRAIMRCYVLNYEPQTSGGMAIVDQRTGQKLPWSPRDLDWICHLFLYSSVQRSPHLWSYDETTLTRALCEAGFEWIRSIERRDWWEVCIEARKDDGTKPEGFERVKLRVPAASASGGEEKQK